MASVPAAVPTPAPPAGSVDEMLARIAREVNVDADSWRSTVMERALRIGQKLAQAKQLLEHGKFLRWVADNTSINPTAANKYVAIASYFSDKLDVSSNFALGASVQLMRASSQGRLTPECEREILEYARHGNTVDKATLDDFRERHGCSRGDWRREARVASLPAGTYRVLLADPPWQYADSRECVTHTGPGASTHYPTMSTDAICNMVGPDDRSVRDLAAPDSVLFLWATVPLLPDALRVIDAWGFTYKTSIVWDKVRPCVGNYTSVGHEYLILATRGSCTPEVTDRPYSIIRAERSSRHSEKPVEAFQLIETLYPTGPHVELFARSRREGWVAWGIELQDHAAA